MNTMNTFCVSARIGICNYRYAVLRGIETPMEWFYRGMGEALDSSLNPAGIDTLADHYESVVSGLYEIASYNEVNMEMYDCMYDAWNLVYALRGPKKPN